MNPRMGSTALPMFAIMVFMVFVLIWFPEVATWLPENLRSGPASVTFGGNVTRGAPLTADANGRAIAVALPAEADTFIVGYAEVSGVAGDIASALIAPGVIPATAP